MPFRPAISGGALVGAGSVARRPAGRTTSGAEEPRTQRAAWGASCNPLRAINRGRKNEREAREAERRAEGTSAAAARGRAPVVPRHHSAGGQGPIRISWRKGHGGFPSLSAYPGGRTVARLQPHHLPPAPSLLSLPQCKGPRGARRCQLGGEAD